MPLYGIKVIEIPRLRKNGEIISASKVRKMISSGNLEEIKSFVPFTTYQYCKKVIEVKMVDSGVFVFTLVLKGIQRIGEKTTNMK